MKGTEKKKNPQPFFLSYPLFLLPLPKKRVNCWHKRLELQSIWNACGRKEEEPKQKKKKKEKKRDKKEKKRKRKRGGGEKERREEGEKKRRRTTATSSRGVCNKKKITTFCVEW